MKEIIDTIVFILFVIVLAFFIIGFNKQQLKKHHENLDKAKKRREEIEEND